MINGIRFIIGTGVLKVKVKVKPVKGITYARLLRESFFETDKSAVIILEASF